MKLLINNEEQISVYDLGNMIEIALREQILGISAPSGTIVLSNDAAMRLRDELNKVPFLPIVAEAVTDL